MFTGWLLTAFEAAKVTAWAVFVPAMVKVWVPTPVTVTS